MNTAPARHRATVRPEWIDYNGHLSEPYYVLVFGDATTNLMELTGLGERYRAETGSSLHTAEAHVRYLHEVAPGTDLLVTTVVLSVGARKVRLCHEMYAEDRLVATEELLAVHVTGSRAAPFPGAVTDRLRERIVPAPEYAGRSVRD
ncbi:4-hydroxybenzoyl-CoA thioesterase [Amycolatopsis antarctica]|uniref:4-hydroxybenzoyl-CoA thioesterase n=1 Tax=Amycolatopsis antarctica TaxID=1854586 RepID=A0A263D056_9PSEU|nr:thioesterase family protein [Amycolatopsis antarctica]OZM71824.1 4-hydroxybenzoyl-CoA thioesterase [Amycolatopsis antarctica]